MGSDNYYDGFDYKSSQDYLEIEYQIDRFEILQCSKAKQRNKPKMRIPSYPISRKNLKSDHPLIKIHPIDDKTKRSEFEQRLFRYNRYPPKKPKPKIEKNETEIFECDKYLGRKSICTRHKKSHLTICPHHFSTFRHHFYVANHKRIKSSLQKHTNIEIVNIRLAPIEKSVQDHFMTRLNENTSYNPYLVYHGTKVNNIESILQYGFLIPNERHPTNRKAPIITVQNGSSYGSGIYCSTTADFSLSYNNTSNTLLVCAALPKRNEAGVVERFHGNILVLSHVSEIIPLFLLDYRCLQEFGPSPVWFKTRYPVQVEIEESTNKPIVISRKHLRKVLNSMQDQIRRKRRSRGRRNNRRKVQKEDDYQVRVFEYSCKEFQCSLD